MCYDDFFECCPFPLKYVDFGEGGFKDGLLYVTCFSKGGGSAVPNLNDILGLVRLSSEEDLVYDGLSE